MGAAGYHQRITGSLSRKSDAAERARKQIAEKMMKERIRSKAPKQRTSRASAVCSRTALAGVPKREWSRPKAGKNGLYRTDWYDPTMLCLVTLLLFVVVLLASWLPARHAAATDPMHALRSE
jgi:hypothetical protein